MSDFGEIKGDTRNGMMETQGLDCTLGKRRYPYRRLVSRKFITRAAIREGDRLGMWNTNMTAHGAVCRVKTIDSERQRTMGDVERQTGSEEAAKKVYAHDLRCQLGPRFLTAVSTVARWSRELLASRSKILGQMPVLGGGLVVAVYGIVMGL